MKEKEYSVWIVGNDWIHDWAEFKTLKEAKVAARDIARVGCGWLEMASLWKTELDEITVQVWDGENQRYSRRLTKDVKDYILKYNKYLR